MLAKAYDGWERAKSRGTAGHYCWDNFLSANTLKMLKDMRRQFCTLLKDMGFLDSDDSRSSKVNRNSSNVKLVKAVICAGLYPNVAKIKRPPTPNSRRPTSLFTPTDRTVGIHPKSVNCDEKAFDSPWFIYHLKMKTTKIYLYDCTSVPPFPLLFFGGSIAVRKDRGDDCIVVDEWIAFRSSKRIAKLVQELRLELDKLLEYKVTHPGVTDWDQTHKEGALMHAILDLITTEEAGPRRGAGGSGGGGGGGGGGGMDYQGEHSAGRHGGFDRRHGGRTRGGMHFVE